MNKIYCGCGCGKSHDRITPLETANRPGLGALKYRAGTYADFYEAMKLRLASLKVPATDSVGQPLPDQTVAPLAKLAVRDPSDPSIALLDAWAVVADLLTFYTERIANEGYLRTAIHRQSAVMLAALTGYVPRPGVASDTLLAYTLQPNASCAIPAGSAAQNVPPQDQLPQTFETSADLQARADWNNLQPRQTRPQLIDPATVTVIYLDGIATQLKPNDMLLLVRDGNPPQNFVRWVQQVDIEQAQLRTRVALRVTGKLGAALAKKSFEEFVKKSFENLIKFYVKNTSSWGFADEKLEGKVAEFVNETAHKAFAADEANPSPEFIPNLIESIQLKNLPGMQLPDVGARKTPVDPALVIWHKDLVSALEEYSRQLSEAYTVPLPLSQQTAPTVNLQQLLKPLLRAPSSPRLDPALLARDFISTFSVGSDVIPRAILAVRPEINRQLYQAYGAAKAAPDQDIKVYAMRVRAPLYGHNAPKEPLIIGTGEDTKVAPRQFWREPVPSSDEGPDKLYLDSIYEKITPKSTVVVVPYPPHARGSANPKVLEAIDVLTVSRADYGLSAKVTQIILTPGETWYPRRRPRSRSNFSYIRRTLVYAQPEELALAQEPMPPEFPSDDAPAQVELGRLYDGLASGKVIVVAGPRSDLPGVTGVEVAMIQQVDQKIATTLSPDGIVRDIPGDQIHTFLTLSAPLNYRYLRDKVTIYGNVVAATQGKSQQQLLGNGDGTQAFQSFQLTQSPLTQVSAPNSAGIKSTLAVTVNGAEWKSVPALNEQGPTDRVYIVGATADDHVKITFGDGIHGLRLPTGTSNISATYRVGLGTSGNVEPQTITTLLARPLGVSGVTNPIPATGGAVPDPIAMIRRNAPAASALDRLVSLADYEDFSRHFAGVAKASASRFAIAGRHIIHVTISAADDSSLSADSPLVVNLRQALLDYGDPHLNVRVAPRAMQLLLLQASIAVFDGYRWDAVQSAVAQTLSARFGFDEQKLGQSIYLSQIIAAIQAVPGVDWAVMEKLEGIPEPTLQEPAQLATLAGKLADGQPLKSVTARLARRIGHFSQIAPAEIVHVAKGVPELIVLKQRANP